MSAAARHASAIRLGRPQKLTVNAVSLIVAASATSVLGLAFWALAAHLDSTAAVGHAFAEVSALTLLATLSQLNMTNVFIRLLPVAGRFTATFITRGYLAVTSVALVVGTAFVASGLGSEVVGAGWAERVMFVVAVALFTIFALQDSVLTSLRIAHWVPVENASAASLRLAILPLLAFLPTRLGPVVAWVLPVTLAVLAVNLLLFTGPVAHTRAMKSGQLPPRREVMSFVAAEYANSLCALATLQVMPLLVLWRLGAVREAYFLLPWLGCLSITMFLWNVGASYVVAVTAHPEDESDLLRRSLRLGAVVVVGGMLGFCVAGPVILELAGPGYSEHGAALLRLFGLSAPLTAVTVVYSTFAWIEKRLWRLVAIEAATGILLLSITFLLLPQVGVSAVGYAYLASEGVAAILMAPALRSRFGAKRAKATTIPAEGLP